MGRNLSLLPTSSEVYSMHNQVSSLPFEGWDCHVVHPEGRRGIETAPAIEVQS